MLFSLLQWSFLCLQHTPPSEAMANIAGRGPWGRAIALDCVDQLQRSLASAEYVWYRFELKLIWWWIHNLPFESVIKYKVSDFWLIGGNLRPSGGSSRKGRNLLGLIPGSLLWRFAAQDKTGNASKERLAFDACEQQFYFPLFCFLVVWIPVFLIWLIVLVTYPK